MELHKLQESLNVLKEADGKEFMEIAKAAEDYAWAIEKREKAVCKKLSFKETILSSQKRKMRRKCTLTAEIKALAAEIKYLMTAAGRIKDPTIKEKIMKLIAGNKEELSNYQNDLKTLT